jgi:hypothetical protein
MTGSKAQAVLTPDGRYIVVRERLWRASNPNLDTSQREHLVCLLMDARRRIRIFRDDPAALARARADVDAAKHQLGERGPVWWTDGAPDYNRYLIKNTPYRAWWLGIKPSA